MRKSVMNPLYPSFTESASSNFMLSLIYNIFYICLISSRPVFQALAFFCVP